MSGSITTMDYAHDIHDKLMTGQLHFVEYIDYEPADEVGFESNIARKLGFAGVPNADIREAVVWLEENHAIFVERVPDEDRQESGSHGQPYPNRLTCRVTLS